MTLNGSIKFDTYRIRQSHRFYGFRTTDRRLRAYNPSLAWFNGTLLMAYRISNYSLCRKQDIYYFGKFWENFYKKGLSPIISKIGLAIFDPYKMRIVKILNLPIKTITACEWCHGFEDPRIFSFRNSIYLLVSYRNEHSIYDLSLIELNENFNDTRIVKVEPEFEKWHHQKNWNPFIFKNELFFVSSIAPHNIARIDLKTGVAKRVFSNHTNVFDDIEDDYSIRGGSSYIDIGNKFLGICRAAKKQGPGSYDPEYKSIFYTFEAKPPFKILRRSNTFYINSSKNKRSSIQMPFGLVEFDNSFLVSYGENDCSLNIAKITKEHLLNYFESENM